MPLMAGFIHENEHGSKAVLEAIASGFRRHGLDPCPASDYLYGWGSLSLFSLRLSYLIVKGGTTHMVTGELTRSSNGIVERSDRQPSEKVFSRGFCAEP